MRSGARSQPLVSLSMATADDPRETRFPSAPADESYRPCDSGAAIAARLSEAAACIMRGSFAGPRGIGKATLAYRLGAVHPGASRSRDRCKDHTTLYVPRRSGVARRIASRGHPDLLVLERQFDPKRERLKSEIVIDDTREAERSSSRGPQAKVAGASASSIRPTISISLPPMRSSRSSKSRRRAACFC